MMTPTFSLFSRLRVAMLCAAVSLSMLGGCASTGDPRDPLEPVNRAVYKFNDGVDNVLLKPAAGMYRDLVPQFIRTGISNFFSNLNDVIVALNNLLQGKVPEAINDVGRVLVNTTLGVFGVMDPATQLGVEKNNEDFGQTLGRWGLGDGPYLVLPFLGPSSLRDTAGLVGDNYTWPGTYLEPTRDRNMLIGLRAVATRADLLEASQILETAALDPYTFVRDAYLQRRRSLVYDGNPPDDSRDNGNDKPKPSSRAPGSPPTPLAAEAEAHLGAVIVSAYDMPPAENEARGHAVPSTPPAPQPAAAAPQATKPSRLVRMWLPGGN